MRRFDVYFLQKRDAAGWETVERAQSASVLVSSMIREFDGEENAELRVVGGDWNATIGEWEFSQIFFVDRGSIDLSLAEPPVSADDDGQGGAGWSDVEREVPDLADAPAARGSASFADAIHAARQESEQQDGNDGYLDSSLTASDAPPTRRGGGYDDTSNEDLRSLGFHHGGQAAEEPVGPPPDFRPEPRRNGRAFFMVGTVIIALILILGAAAALMVAFKVDPAPRYIEMLRDWKQSAAGGPQDAPADADTVMPQTAGDAQRHAGVAPDLQGRWSSGDCAQEYIEFGADAFQVKASGRDPSVAVPVVETLEDEYTWYIRRSDSLVEHFQKLGDDDIQMIGDTTPVGFTQRTSEVYSRCQA
ncbi:hypothetical protein [Thalassobaculum salexigens]|uniref:hypothetical protein n=1 Tax=Thalassobaculum salexigens TaxID=455360 RepID=UPI0003F5CA4A|nr:hypothetical protein [Thalassobaculum salexigens]